MSKTSIVKVLYATLPFESIVKNLKLDDLPIHDAVQRDQWIDVLSSLQDNKFWSSFAQRCQQEGLHPLCGHQQLIVVDVVHDPLDFETATTFLAMTLEPAFGTHMSELFEQVGIKKQGKSYPSPFQQLSDRMERLVLTSWQYKTELETSDRNTYLNLFEDDVLCVGVEKALTENEVVMEVAKANVNALPPLFRNLYNGFTAFEEMRKTASFNKDLTFDEFLINANLIDDEYDGSHAVLAFWFEPLSEDLIRRAFSKEGIGIRNKASFVDGFNPSNYWF